MKNNIWKIIAIVFAVIICIILAGLIINNKKEDKKDKEDKTSEQINLKTNSSFYYKMLSKDSLDLSEDEELVLDYFDNSSVRFTSRIALVSQKYTSLFKNMKLYVEGTVLDILESNDDKYKAIIKIYDDDYDVEEDENHYCIIEGKQAVKRFQKGDNVSAYGTFATTELIEYNKEKYTMPKLNVSKWSENGENFSNDEVKRISRFIFGENIKFDTVKGCAYNPYCENYPLAGYLVKLEDPKNSNYTMFNVFRGGGFIEIGYCNEDNFMDLCDNTQKNIEVAYDYKHFIIATYEKATETVYLEYYDQQFNKIWRKELDKEGKIDKDSYRAYYDYNDNFITLVMDGYLYLINIEDGKDLINPVLIGTDHSLLMLPNYILLTGYSKKDYIIVMDYKGNIIKKLDITDSNIDTIYNNYVQLVDGKALIVTMGMNKDDSRVIYKVLKLDENFDIDIESDDIS